MVASCAANGCTQRGYKKGISLHKFPKDNLIFQKWVQAIEREDWIPSEESRICSRHFSPDCYEQNGWSSRKSLKLDAVPSIFVFPDQSPKNGTKRLAPCERHEDFEAVSVQNDTGDNGGEQKGKERKKRQFYVGDFELSLESLPSSVAQQIEKCKKVIADKNKRIKVLKQRHRRLLKKVETLESLVEHLQSKNLTTEESSSVLLVPTDT